MDDVRVPYTVVRIGRGRWGVGFVLPDGRVHAIACFKGDHGMGPARLTAARIIAAHLERELGDV